MPTCLSLPICIFPLDPKTNPPPNPKDILSCIASHLIHGTNELVRFVNIQFINESSSPHKDARILRGTINLFIPEKKAYVPWLWEAISYPLTQGIYHWKRIILFTHTEENGLFDEDRLNRVAAKIDADENLSLIERVACFMIGCLVHCTNKNAELIRNGVELTDAKHTKTVPSSAYVYKQCPICMLPPPP